jgi:hypothetical protein
MAKELEVHSPSRKAMELGRYFGEGIVLGLDEQASAVAEATRRLADGMDISKTVGWEINRANTELGRLRTNEPEGEGMLETGSVMNQTVNVYVDHIESMKEIERIAATQRTNIRMGYTKG